MKRGILIMMLTIGSSFYAQEPRIKLCGTEHDFPKGERIKSEWTPLKNIQLEKLLQARKLLELGIINRKGYDSIRVSLRREMKIQNQNQLW